MSRLICTVAVVMVFLSLWLILSPREMTDMTTFVSLYTQVKIMDSHSIVALVAHFTSKGDD